MLDFKKKDLFKREQVKMRNFLDKKLLTNSQSEADEYTAQMNGDGMGVLEAGNFIDGDALEIGGDSDGFGGFGGFGEFGEDDGFGGFGSAGDRSGVKGATDWHYQGQPLKTFFMSPLYMIKYIFQDLTNDFPKGNEWVGILKVLNTVNIFCVITALFAMALGVNTIFSPIFQLIAGLSMHILTTIIIKVGFKEDTKLIQFAKEIMNKDDESTGLGDEDTSFSLFDEDEGEGLELGHDMDAGGMAFGALEEREDSLFGMDDGEDDYEETEDEDEDFDTGSGLAESPISVESDDSFMNDLLEVFAKSDRYMGKMIPERIQLVHSFSEYLIQNNRNFGSWVRPRENGVVYNNIAYALFKGLCQLETQFASYQNEDRMHIIDIKESPLLYRIELELPDYFKERKIQSNLKVLEDVLKETEDDLNVSIIVSTFQGNFVIKLLRLDNKQLVTLGDILRFNDEDRGYVGLNAFADDDYGLPVLMGLQNNENPYIVDWEANTSGTIIGGSGSGKSWATFEMMLNFVISNDYNNVNFIVLDAKNAPFWNAFARFPHVLGYHYDPGEYIDILREVEDERKRRQEMLNELGAEDMKGYRKSLRRKKEYDKLKEVPLLFLVVDEITATMAELKETDEELFKTAANLLGQISSKGRSAGVRVLSIGQRSTFDSVPKTLMANSSFKFGMKMEVQNDFITLFGDDVKRYKTPNATGMGLSKTEGSTTLQTIKTLTIGGTNNEQMLMLIRTLAFDWLRRSHGVDDVKRLPPNLPFQKSYNRDRFYDRSMKEMQEGRILVPSVVNEGYEVIFPDESSQQQGHRIQAMQDRLKAAEDKRRQHEKQLRKEEDEELNWVSDVVTPTFEEERDEEELPPLAEEDFTNEDFGQNHFGSFDTDSVFGGTEENQISGGFIEQTESTPFPEEINRKEEYQETWKSENEDSYETIEGMEGNSFGKGLNQLFQETQDEPINSFQEEDIGYEENEEDDVEDISWEQISSKFDFPDIDDEEDGEEENGDVQPFPVKEFSIDNETIDTDIDDATEREIYKNEENYYLETDKENKLEEEKETNIVSLDQLMQKYEKEEKQDQKIGEDGGEVTDETVEEHYGETIGEVGINRYKSPEKPLEKPINTEIKDTSLEFHHEVHHGFHHPETDNSIVSLDSLLTDAKEELEEEEKQEDEESDNKEVEQNEAALLRKQLWEREQELKHLREQQETEYNLKLEKEREKRIQLQREKELKEEEQRKAQEAKKEETRIKEENQQKEIKARNEENQNKQGTSATPSENQTDKKDGIELEFISPVREVKQEPTMPIKAYIATYGTSKGFNVYMSVEEIRSVYSERRIKEALDRLLMIESKGYYIVRM